MVNLARSAALCCTITTLICGLTSLLQLSGILLCINREAYRHNRQRCIEMLTFSSIRSNDEAQRPENEIAGLDRFRVNPSKPCRFRCGFQVMKPFPLETASV